MQLNRIPGTEILAGQALMMGASGSDSEGQANLADRELAPRTADRAKECTSRLAMLFRSMGMKVIGGDLYSYSAKNNLLCKVHLSDLYKYPTTSEYSYCDVYVEFYIPTSSVDNAIVKKLNS